jgi:hypothetical protein
MEPESPDQNFSVLRLIRIRFPENQHEDEAEGEQDEEDLEDEIDDRLFFLRETLGTRHVLFMVFNPTVAVSEPLATEPLNFVPVDETGTRAALEGEDECCVCMNNFPDAVIMPCSHAVVCCVCANQIGRTTGICPLCRTGNITVNRVSDDSSQE